MDFDTLSKWLAFVSLVISVITAIWTLVNKSTKPYDDKLALLETKSNAHAREIQSLQDEVKHLPRSTDVHEMRLLMAKLEGHVGKIEVTLQASERKLDRIERSIDARPS